MSQYDVFLAHNKADQAAVEVLAHRLKQESKLDSFVDEWNLSPSESWRVNLQRTLDKSRTCAVFWGPKGQGSWEHEEMRAYLHDRIKEDKSFRLIPVLLPRAVMPKRGQLPGFLSRLVWARFRGSLDDVNAYRRLVSGIKGIVPVPSLLERLKTPYRGLEKFRPEDAKLFFGRDSETQQLVEELKTSRFLAVLGASGSGKSSVVLAGLVPALQKGALPDSNEWPILIFTPTKQPLEELAVHLAELFPDQNVEYVAQMEQLLQDFSNNEKKLHLMIIDALKNAPENRSVVLVVDQFEEAFTLCQDAHIRQQFFANLLYASEIHGGRTIVVLTMRADFVAKCADYSDLADRLSTFNFFVTPMKESQLREVIERPAARAGVRFEEGLADLMLQEVKDQAGGLPLLEHTLLKLWQERDKSRQKLTFNAYHEIGGVAGALAHSADATYDLFNDQQRKIAQRILLQLVQPGEGTEDTRRRAKLSELVTRESETETLDVVLQHLANERLITINQERNTNETIVNIAHEALIRNWPRLREWIDQNRENLRFQRRLREAAEEWERLGRDEGALYRGVRLAQAEEWTKQYSDDLNKLEGEFIEASKELIKNKEDQEEKRRQRELEQARTLAEEKNQRAVLLRRALGGLSTLLIIAVVAALFAFYLYGVTTQQASIVTSDQLATQAESVLEQDPELSLLLALEALNVTKRVDEPPILDAEQALRDALTNTGGIGLGGHTRPIVAVAINEQWLVSASYDNTIRVWDQKGSNLIELKGDFGSINALAISDEWLVTGSDDKVARLWDLQKLATSSERDPIPLDGHDGPILAVAISDNWLMTGSSDNTARLWDLRELPDLRFNELKNHNGAINAVAISKQWVVTGSADSNISIWSLSEDGSTELVNEFTKHEDPINTVAISNEWLITASDDKTVRLLNLENFRSILLHRSLTSAQTVAVSGQRLTILNLNGKADLWDFEPPKPLSQSPIQLKDDFALIQAIAMNEDKLLTGYGDKNARYTDYGDNNARLWDIQQLEAQPIIVKGYENAVKDATFSSDKRWLATASDDNTARLLNLQQPEAQAIILKGHETPIKKIAVSPNKQWVIGAGSDTSLCLWKIQGSEADCTELKNNSGLIHAVAINNKRVVVANDDHIIRVWDIEQPQSKPAELKGHQGPIKAMAISNKWLVSTSSDNTARLWNLEEQNADYTILKGHKRAITTVAISPDEQWVVTASTDYIPRLWRLEEEEVNPEPIKLKGDSGLINAVAISDKWLATAGSDNAARLWDLKQLEPDNPLILRGHENPILAVSISEDNNWLVTGSSDKTARLWNLQQVEREQEPKSVVLRDHTSSVNAVAISPGLGPDQDNRWLVTASSNGTARLWNLQLEELIDLACRTAGRNLSLEEWRLYFGDEPYRKTCPDLPVHYSVEESGE